MIYLLLGPDDFSKKAYSKDLESLGGLDVATFFDDADEQGIVAASGGSLFGGGKVVKAYNFLSKGTYSDEFITRLKNASGTFIFIEDILDKRKAGNKKLLADKDITVKEFKIPSGDALKKWIIDRSKEHGLKISSHAIQAFMQRIGDGQGEFGKELYSLWQVDSELKKIKAYVGSREAGVDDVLLLVPENLEENVFKITNAIGDKDKKRTIKYLQEHMDRIPGDEKAKILSLSALLAEQFRSILIVQSLVEKGVSDAEAASLTGFSPGRIFIYKKISKNFKREKVLEALQKLEFLDEEMKTGNSPASLQLFMIIENVLRG